jgi:hypothetical protein
MKKLIVIIFIAALAFPVFAQTKPCSSPEASQFDFWVGNWDLTWNDSVKGTNTITKIMDGCAVHEQFSDPKNNGKGESWSMYNVQKGKWQQTWIDNSGNYMLFEGGMKNGNMELSFEQPGKDGKVVIMSMLYYNITANEFDWDWRSSNDNGKTWTSKWKIHYKRKTAETR